MEKHLTFLIKFLGCKVNSYESEALANILLNNGYSLFNEEEEGEPDLIIINTCAVTNTSVIKDKKTIKHYRKCYPNAILFVMGCYSSFGYDEIANKLGADIVIGTQNRDKIIQLINDYKTTKNRLILRDSKTDFNYEELKVSKFLFNTRAYLKIQDGCNNFCSYCLIPFVRGRSRSRKKEDILLEVKELIKNDYKEIVLTGIDMTSYGLDCYTNYNFSNLLEDILKENPDLYRLRISSIEESNIDEKFLFLLKKYSNLADHLHVPLQSGSKKIVELMHRKYNLAEFEEKINLIRKIRPNIAITTDIIVGFPGENEEDFLETYNFARKIKFSKIHVFPFSPRKGTIAEKLPNKVDDKTKKDRVKRLIDLSTQLENEYNSRFYGNKVEFLMENIKGNLYRGHSSNFLEMNFESDKNLTGKIIELTYKK